MGKPLIAPAGWRRANRSMRRQVISSLLRVSCVLPFFSALSFAQELPITGISHVAFRVSDLDKARSFYTGVLGYPEAFQMKNKEGAVSIAFMKINDDQYIEVQPGLKEGEDRRLTHVAMITTDAPQLQKLLTQRGIESSKVRQGGDGNRAFRIKDPEGNIVEFTEYLPGSLHSNARGKHNDARRVSMRLLHAGVPVLRSNLDTVMAFYRDKLGFVEIWRGGRTDADLNWINMKMPGRGDYIELMIHDGAPTRAQLGSMQHICLEVDSIQAAHKQLRAQGLLDEERTRPRIGRNKRWQLNTFDPDGSRTELMEPRLAAP